MSEPLHSWHFELPEDRIARFPPEKRDGGRLLVVPEEGWQDRQIRDLDKLIRPGDLLVVNDTKVLHARIRARRASGGSIEVLLLGVGPGPVQAMLRPSRRLKVGEVLDVEGGSLTLQGKAEGGAWWVQCSPEPMTLMDQVGEIPLPPYFQRKPEPSDKHRYQTRFADQAGAIAAPTAGLHLSDALIQRLKDKGVQIAAVTLHVGAGTFRNLRPEDLERGELHPERYRISEQTAQAIADCKARGGRVIAVGTTSTRTLESCADGQGGVKAGEGSTRLFIRPGFVFQVIDGLLTNFHLPGSSLLMLVGALVGRKRLLEAYSHAVYDGYRFYSYGDVMLLLPKNRAN